MNNVNSKHKWSVSFFFCIFSTDILNAFPYSSILYLRLISVKSEMRAAGGGSYGESNNNKNFPSSSCTSNS